jgi:hypothetical protein
LGRVGAEVTIEQGYHAARLVALAHLGSLKRALADLDRVTAWLRVFAMVNVAPGFNQTPRVTNVELRDSEPHGERGYPPDRPCPA